MAALRPTKDPTRVRSAQWLGGFAIMRSISIASLGGSKLGSLARTTGSMESCGNWQSGSLRC